jgi:hypothetical protein
VLIEQGLAAQLCNSLYEQEKKLERELAAEGAQLGRARDWGSFLYKKREFSIQDIIIYHYISCQYHFVSCCIIIIFSYIMSLVDT